MCPRAAVHRNARAPYGHCVWARGVEGVAVDVRPRPLPAPKEPDSLGVPPQYTAVYTEIAETPKHQAPGLPAGGWSSIGVALARLEYGGQPRRMVCTHPDARWT